MKIIKIVWMFISVLLIIFVVFALVNSYVSVKYEVEEPVSTGKISEAIGERAKYLREMITWLWIFLSFLLGNMILYIIPLFSRLRNSGIMRHKRVE